MHETTEMDSYNEPTEHTFDPRFWHWNLAEERDREKEKGRPM